ncbi:hypothetical protein ACNKHL_23410 [Shigella flexneri]
MIRHQTPNGTIIGQFRIFYVALDTPGQMATTGHGAVRETDKAPRNVIHASKLCFITLTPEIISSPMVKAANAFSFVSQSFAAETSGNLPLKPRKTFFKRA